ncbi:hypothetical protein COLO4_12535 [Corchorus olitorius]|uniref:Uncharacterized protein n=1 Tax=Corchorus olitorius TaxID=93759 RepID=A0A1R3K0X0_9ROSI|nr:hypothetical protein COLO4_12535 [Corchorus olitorius]
MDTGVCASKSQEITHDVNKNKGFPDAAMNEESSPKTPKDCVFDPFAPGPEEKFLGAPRRKKYVDRMNLKFDYSVKKVLDFSSNNEWDSDDCKTPPGAPRLNGVAETCPGAPIRPSKKSKISEKLQAEPLFDMEKGQGILYYSFCNYL